MTLALENESTPKSPHAAGNVFKKGFWAVADQGLFAGSNCVINVMLARWLSPVEYGEFATAFAAFLALGVIHTALLTEPMLVFSPDRYRHRHKHYFGTLIYCHIIVALAASLVLLAGGLFLGRHGSSDLSRALFGFAAAGPFILFLWLMRRTCYGQLNPKRAAMGGVLYLVLIMTSLAVTHRFTTLTVSVALTIIGASSLVAGLWLGFRQIDLRPPAEMFRDVTAEHLRYGRWATGTQLLGFIPVNIYYFLLPNLATVEQSGALRALTNMFMPLLQANTALCLLLLPAFVRTQGTAEGKKLHRLSLLVLAGCPLIYWIFIGTFARQAIGLVYGGKFLEYSGLVWIIGVQPVIAGACGVYASLLKARGKVNAVFWGGFVAAVGAVTLGVAMTKMYGLTGVCWSIAITYGLHHITLWLFSRNMKWPNRIESEAEAETETREDLARQLPEPA
jgi:O-antigen/teichoic acid export membrane protein